MQQQSSKAGQPTVNGSVSKWQLVAELELFLGVDNQSRISSWLLEVLSPLQLHMDFLDKALKSVEVAAARALQTETVTKHQHLHFLIYIPRCRPVNVQT